MSFIVRSSNPDSDEDCAGIAAAIDVAFVEGDSWFKKNNCKHRCETGDTIKSILTAETCSTFLLAENQDGKILGALRVDWNEETNIGHFGMLGVPSANAGQGIGKALVAATILFLKDEKSQTEIQIPVVATRNERLIAWYEGQGFKCIGDIFPFPAPEIMLEEYVGKIDMVQMRREL